MSYQRNNDSRPIVYFDLSLADRALGRIEMELYKDVVPKTSENFRCLCTGERSHTGGRMNSSSSNNNAGTEGDKKVAEDTGGEKKSEKKSNSEEPSSSNSSSTTAAE